MSGYFSGACAPFPTLQEINSWMPTKGLTALCWDTIHVCVCTSVCLCVCVLMGACFLSVWIILCSRVCACTSSVYEISPPPCDCLKVCRLSALYWMGRSLFKQVCHAFCPPIRTGSVAVSLRNSVWCDQASHNQLIPNHCLLFEMPVMVYD